MGALNLRHFLFLAVVLAVFVIPGVQILRKAGFSGWWVLLWFVPVANVLALWLFAFTTWPVERTGRGAN